MHGRVLHFPDVFESNVFEENILLIYHLARILPKDRFSLKKRHRLRLVKRLIIDNKKDPTPRRDRVVVEVPPAGGDTTGGSNNNSPPCSRIDYTGLRQSVLFLDVLGALLALGPELSVKFYFVPVIISVIIQTHQSLP